MVIRPGGYNTGAQEYLETGNKSGREFTRDELDHRLVIDGNLDLTRSIYESIPDRGQDRYLTFTISFREDAVADETLRAVTLEFKQFLMHAYKSEEFNFYAEAHIPKIKSVKDKKTGEMVDRKPHVHVIVPRINLLSGNEANPVGIYLNHEKHFEAFQEYLNQKYNLASPRDHVRVNIDDAASVLSRYKGDDFYGKNREFKQSLVTELIQRDIRTREGFYALAAEYGETRIRNAGKENEYLSVKLPGDAKNTNLKETIFQDNFIVNRELKKPPLDPRIIQERLQQWPQRAMEIKYVDKATPSFRKRYTAATADERVQLLAERETKFYQTYGDHHVGIQPPQRPRDHQRSATETQGRRPARAAHGLQDVSSRDVADHGQAGSAGRSDGTVLLPNDAHVHLGQHQPGGNLGLRSPVPGGRGRRGTDAGGRRREPTAAVPSSAARTRKGTGSGGRNTRPRTGLTDNPLPPHARNPHRMASISDIQARGRRLFDPLKPTVPEEPAFELDMSKLMTPEPRGSGSSQAVSRPTRKRRPGDASPGRAARYLTRPTDNPLPPFARNPRRVPSIDDIQRRGQRLFEPTRPIVKPLQVKLPSIKALTTNRNASTVAAYFSRQAEQNELLPAQRHALRRVNQQYFQLRRAVFSDPRFSRQDKVQLVSVLTFERLKANEQIRNPLHHSKVTLMGSADIRNLVDDREDPGYSISGPKGADIEVVRYRVKRIMDRLSRQVDPEANSERAKELSAKDLYTRKSRFSQNVHYLDKNTDKTLFVDSGTAISMRRTGITEAGVSVALQLAKERFGSTLTINGTPEFKALVIEAVAKNGMDIHFTDKAMNQSLAARRAELEIGKEGQTIASPAAEQTAVVESTAEAKPTAEAADVSAAPIDHALNRFVDNDTRAARDLADRMGTSLQIERLAGEGKTPEEIAAAMDGVLGGQVSPDDRLKHVSRVLDSLGVPDRSIYGAGEAAFAQWRQDRGQLTQVYAYDINVQSPSELVQREAQYRQSSGMNLRDADVRASSFFMDMRAQDNAMWLVATQDSTPEATAMLTAYLQNDAYREAFKSTIDSLYVQYQDSPETIASLDTTLADVVEIVHEVETRGTVPAEAATQTSPPQTTPVQALASKPAIDRKQVKGELVDHGAAPYQHQEGKQQSYFVTLKTDAGERTVWGVGLESAMQNAGAQPGEPVKLVDHGTVPVVIQVIAEDGSVSDKTTQRREWTAERISPEREVSQVNPAQDHAGQSQEESGMAM